MIDQWTQKCLIKEVEHITLHVFDILRQGGDPSILKTTFAELIPKSDKEQPRYLTIIVTDKLPELSDRSILFQVKQL